MNIIKIFWVLALAVASQSALAYNSGSSSSRKQCDKMDLTEFAPADKSTTSEGAEFSFKASKRINPDRIKVTVKGQAVKVDITPAVTGFVVKGTLPESLGSFARINIVAEGLDKCEAKDGWLLNISE